MVRKSKSVPRAVAAKIIRYLLFLACMGAIAVFGMTGLIALSGSADISKFERGSILVISFAPIPWFIMLTVKVIIYPKRLPVTALLCAVIFSATMALNSLIRLEYCGSAEGLSNYMQRLNIELQSILFFPVVWGAYTLIRFAMGINWIGKLRKQKG